MGQHPINICPNCSSVEMGCERVRPIADSSLMEAYVKCFRCKSEIRTRHTTKEVESALINFRRLVSSTTYPLSSHMQMIVTKRHNELEKLSIRAGVECPSL